MKNILNKCGYISKKVILGIGTGVTVAAVGMVALSQFGGRDASITGEALSQYNASSSSSSSGNVITPEELSSRLTASEITRNNQRNAIYTTQGGGIKIPQGGGELGYGTDNNGNTSDIQNASSSIGAAESGGIEGMGSSDGIRGVDGEVVNRQGKAGQKAEAGLKAATPKGEFKTSGSSGGGFGGGGSSGAGYTLPTVGNNLADSGKVNISQFENTQERLKGLPLARSGGRAGAIGGSNISGGGRGGLGAGQSGAGFGAGSNLATARKYSKLAADTRDSAKSAAAAGHAFDGGVEGEAPFIDPNGTVRTSDVPRVPDLAKNIMGGGSGLGNDILTKEKLQAEITMWMVISAVIAVTAIVLLQTIPKMALWLRIAIAGAAILGMLAIALKIQGLANEINNLKNIEDGGTNSGTWGWILFGVQSVLVGVALLFPNLAKTLLSKLTGGGSSAGGAGGVPPGSIMSA
ncbi:MAG: hypothetical protein LBG46_07565 [Elusimicrobiota bacterium]|nr:hypothetical protein [Elusimicrobiota bacterium]